MTPIFKTPFTSSLPRALTHQRGALKAARRAIFNGAKLDALTTRDAVLAAAMWRFDPRLSASEALNWLVKEGVDVTPEKATSWINDILRVNNGVNPVPALAWLEEKGGQFPTPWHLQELRHAGRRQRLTHEDLSWLIQHKGFSEISSATPHRLSQTLLHDALSTDIYVTSLSAGDLHWLNQLLNLGLVPPSVHDHRVPAHFPTLLHRLAFQISQQSKVQSTLAHAVQGTWVRLVTSGEDPCAPGPDGYTPMEHLAQSPLAEWAQAWARSQDRQMQLQGEPSAIHAPRARRMRS